MSQNILTIEYSDDLLYRLGVSRERFSDEAKFLLGAKLYELGRLSSGEAAQLAGRSRVEFLFALPNIRLPMNNLREENLPAELDFALDELTNRRQYQFVDSLAENADIRPDWQTSFRFHLPDASSSGNSRGRGEGLFSKFSVLAKGRAVSRAVYAACVGKFGRGRSGSYRISFGAKHFVGLSLEYNKISVNQFKREFSIEKVEIFCSAS